VSSLAILALNLFSPYKIATQPHPSLFTSIPYRHDQIFGRTDECPLNIRTKFIHLYHSPPWPGTFACPSSPLSHPNPQSSTKLAQVAWSRFSSKSLSLIANIYSRPSRPQTNAFKTKLRASRHQPSQRHGIKSKRKTRVHASRLNTKSIHTNLSRNIWTFQ
jgi:hypothetical protein